MRRGCWARSAALASAIAAAAILSARPSELPPRVDLWFGGDVNMGTGEKEILSPLAGVTKGAAGIINLEGPVSPRIPAGGGVKLVNAPASLPKLLQIGVRVANIANNHAQDAGDAGPGKTAGALRAAGILPAGGEAGAATLDLGGLRIVVAGFDLTGGVPPRLAARLAGARKQGDVLVASFHVTGPPSYLPRPELRRAVKIALQSGARIIVAHGTHTVGAVERRADPDDAIIAWGLGNMAFDCDCTAEQEAILLRVSLEGGRVRSASVIPIQAGLRGESTRLSPDPNGIFDLLEAIGSSKMVRHGFAAEF